MVSLENKQNTVDQLVLFRARMLLFSAFSFALWQLSWLGMDVIASRSSMAFQIAGWSNVIGAVCWAIASILFLKFNHQVKRSSACSALHDELTVKNRNIAFVKSFFVIIGLVWALIPLMDAVPFDAKHAVRLIAVIGITLPMVLFSISELKNDEGAD